MSGTVTPDPAEVQRTAALKLFEQLWGDPEVGEPLRRRAKALNSGITIPDDNPVAVQVKGELAQTKADLAALRTVFDERVAADAQRDAESKLRNQIGDVQAKRKLTDDGMAGVIKIMQDRQIADPDAAAALYIESLPKPAPTGGGTVMPSAKLNLYGTQSQDDAWATLHQDPDKFFADVVNQVFTEMPVAA